MKIIIINSLKNQRGIYNYSYNLYKSLKRNYPTYFLTANYRVKFNNYIKYFWEVFLAPYNKEAINIYTYSRLPIKLIFKKNKNCGIVVYDFMQIISFKNFKKNYKFIKENNIIKFIQYSINTFFFNLSINKVDFIICISEYTLKQLDYNYSKKVLNIPKYVIYPQPSFIAEKLTINKKTTSLNENKKYKIIVITGNSENKRSHLTIPILKEIAKNNLNEYFEVDIFGINFDKSLVNSNSSNLKINIMKKFVPDEILIQSYLNSSIYLNTSIDEGFGIPLLDSILFSLTCIVPEIPTFKEIKNNYKDFSTNIYTVPLDFSNDKYYYSKTFQKAKKNIKHISKDQKLKRYIKWSKKIREKDLNFSKKIFQKYFKDES